MPVEHGPVAVERRAGAAGEPEGALAERDGGVELGVEGQGAGVGALEGRARRRACGGQVDEPLADVDARRTSMPRRARAWAWRPGPQPTSSTRMPGLEPERVDEERRPPARCPW